MTKIDKIINILNELIKYEYLKENGQFKIRPLQKIINEYKKNSKITLDELSNIKGIGKSSIEKVKEIIETGKLKYLDELKEEYKNIIKLTKVKGIGIKLAYKLYNEHNIKTIKDLKKNSNLLSKGIIINLKYYNDSLKKIPRSEIKLLDNHIKNNISNDIKYKIVGSYRREKDYSNDIDILIYSKDKLIDKFLKIIEKPNKIKPKIKDTLFKGTSKFKGYIKINNNLPVRSLDILYISDIKSWPFSLLYFTGSKEFNQRMRSYALNKGYRLNEYGLFNSKTNKLVNKTFKNEKDIFDYLKLKYLEPSQRN